jgi:hypothetical protein
MATKAKKTALKVPAFNAYFSQSHQGYHLQGKEYRDLFEEAVVDFFSRMKHHLYIAGQPGVGKTFFVELIAKKYPTVDFIPIKQSMTPWAFVKMIAVARWRGEMTGRKTVFYIDDFNAIFKANSEFLDMFKNAMDKKSGDRLEYNRSLGAQYDQADDIEKQAIDYWIAQNPDRTGFVISFNKSLKFIFTMNTPLPSEVELAKHPVGSDRWIKVNNRCAIRSRVNYEDLVMTKEVYWGWIAEVLWNAPGMCVGSTVEQKFEMLNWMWDNWDTVSEHSLRFIEEKLWDVMERYPVRHQYLTRWEKLKG